MNQIERISEMEQRLDRAQAASRALARAWEAYLAVEDDFACLDAYLGSPEWHTDREADAAGLLPPGLHRGVLSEDAIYDLLQSRQELLQEIHTAAQ